MKNIIITIGLLLSIPASLLCVQPESASNYKLEIDLKYRSENKLLESFIQESITSFPFEGIRDGKFAEIKYKITTGNNKFLVDALVFEKNPEGPKLISEPALVLVLDKEGMVHLRDTQGNELVIKATISQK